MKQLDILLDYLKENGSATGLDIIGLGIMNYKGRICDLRQLGYEIKTVMETGKNRSGQSVIAKDYSTGKTAEAKCNPADEFDFHTGAKLAFTRLVDPDREAKPSEPEKPKYYTGKVVCVKAHYPDMWTVGKVYTVIDGKTFDDYGDVRDEITSPAQMSSVTDPRNEFIEYKGGA